MRKWTDLPQELQTEEVRKYYDVLKKKPISRFFKRAFDILFSAFLLLLFSPLFLTLAIAIKVDSKGPVFYRQVRITRYGKQFRIHKFRSMVVGADKGSQVTVSGDSRVTKVGKLIRNCRLDEISQLIDVLQGNMTFVGTRPEVPKYVATYTPRMMATLLLPAGVTSEASVYYKDEAELLDASQNPDETYVQTILPQKMEYNLREIEHFHLGHGLKVMVMTVLAVLGVKFKGKTVGAKK
ncbi:MAG: sugar transferase [Ruminococcaceae bacterium]|nr:sugar transferase [Oscillospiraceae bacterium]